MDFSGLFAFMLGMLSSGVLWFLYERRLGRSNFVPGFLVALGISIAFFRPWEALYPNEWIEGLVIIFVIAAWTAAGSAVGRLVARWLGRKR